MTKVARKKYVVTAAVVCVFSAVFGGAAALSAQSGLQTPRRVVTVQLAVDNEGRKNDLRTLSTFDFMGLDTRTGEAQFFVSHDELADLQKRGFQISFGNRALESLQHDIEANAQKYLSPSLLKAKLEQLQADSNGLLVVREFGTTHRDRPMLVAELTSQNGKREDKPAILFNAMHHARELMTTEVAVHLIEKFVSTNSTANTELQKWLDSYRILVVPQVNPDGNDLVHSGQTMWRKNAWAPRNKVVGVDLNRNYPANWNTCNGSSGNQNDITYRGPAPGSEPEVQAMMALIAEQRPVANISYHSYSEMVLYPFGCENEVNTALDLYKNIAADIRKETIDDTGRPNTYEVGTPPELLYSADGGDIDWHWKSFGVVSFAMEVNSPMLGFRPDYNKWRDLTVQRLEGSWKALLKRMDKNAIRARVTLADSLSSRGLNPKDRITYRLQRANTVHAPWADTDVEPFHLRNDSGLFYQIALPGPYEIVFLKDGVEAKRIAVNVTDGVVDMGEISL